MLARTRAQLRVAERAATRATEVSGRAREVSFDVTDMLYDARGHVRGVRHRMRAEVHPAGPRVLDDVDNAERVLDGVIELWDEVSSGIMAVHYDPAPVPTAFPIAETP